MDQDLALCALDASHIMRLQGLTPSPSQTDVLNCPGDMVLNCHRGWGKTHVIGTKAIHKAVFTPGSLSFVVSGGMRQAMEVIRYARVGYYSMKMNMPLITNSKTEIELDNGSRIISRPTSEDTARGFNGCDLLIFDEVARIPDVVINSLTTITASAVRKRGKVGQTVYMSTPKGPKGLFYKIAIRIKEKEPKALKKYRYFEINADESPWLSKEYLEEELTLKGQSMFMQEYYNSFDWIQGMVYPQFDSCCIDELPGEIEGRLIGGIDWGWNDPCAILWGIYHKESDTIYVLGEMYAPHVTCPEWADRLKVMNLGHGQWGVDPASPERISEFRSAGLNIFSWKGSRDIMLGVQGVSARMNTGRIKFVDAKRKMPNLCREMHLYRYPTDDEVTDLADREKPFKKDSHTPDALRYLCSQHDRHYLASRRAFRKEIPEEERTKVELPKQGQQFWDRIHDERFWVEI